MKTAAILSLFTASASAFAPAPAAKSGTSLNVVPAPYNPDLDNMVGATVETGGKPVSLPVGFGKRSVTNKHSTSHVDAAWSMQLCMLDHFEMWTQIPAFSCFLVK